MLRSDEPVRVWAISVDSPGESKAFAEAIAADGRGGVAFQLLSVPQHRVIDACGLRDPRYAKVAEAGIPYPAANVVDRAGRIAWARIDTDYAQRPPNREIRAALDALAR